MTEAYELLHHAIHSSQKKMPWEPYNSLSKNPTPDPKYRRRDTDQSIRIPPCSSLCASGQILGQEARPGAQQIDALVPLSEMFGYATDLRSRTQGRGQYTMEPHSYVEIPKNIAEKIIAQRGRKEDA